MSQQLRFGFAKDSAAGVCVRSVARMTDGQVRQPYYTFPTNLQAKSNHTELFKIEKVKIACKQMVDERNLTVTLPEETAKLYMDDDLNFVFQTNYLDELREGVENGAKPKDDRTQKNPSTTDLLVAITKLTKIIEAKNSSQKISPKDAMENMSLDRFRGADDGPDWLRRFESECDRLKINEDRDKVVLLKTFMEGPAEAWADVCDGKLDYDDYNKWAEAFTTTFTKKSWESVRAAHAFKYLSGSLTDYAIEKQKRLLNIENDMTDRSLIDNIVVNLPDYAREKLDREAVTTTNVLFTELGKIEVRRQQNYQPENT